MAVTDVGSYGPTGHAFEAHWADVNTDRTENALAELALPDGYSVADLTSAVAAVESAVTLTIDLENAVSSATQARDILRVSLRAHVIEFREAIDYRLKGTGHQRALPETPYDTASEQKLLKALDDVQSIWTRVNADGSVANFTPPLLLREGVTLADFDTDLAAMRTAYREVTQAENDLRMSRKERDILLEPLRGRFVEYRQAINVEYGPGHPFTDTLPDVYSSPGSTPDALTISGSWDADSEEAVLTWTDSTNANLSGYSIRMSPAESYDAADSIVIGSEDPGTEEFRTVDGLDNPDDVASFRIFVQLSTGNSAGSNTVTITRP